MTTYIQNRKARHEYELLTNYEAGLVLTGHEVKAVRAGKAKLDGAFVKIYHGEAVLLGASIAPYQPSNTPDSYDPERTRTLLLHKKELSQLERKLQESNLTIVPLSLYDSKGKIKLKLSLARGRKKADKRETLKLRAQKRDIERTLKGE